MTSSVDPRGERDAIKARLSLLPEALYEGIPQGFSLPIDAYGNRSPYRDLQPGNTIPAARQRMLGANEQNQPHIWAFQISHFATERDTAFDLAIQTDISLIGWEPTVNASSITSFYFNVYDEFNKTGAVIGWIATRFYETTLGQSPTLN